MDAVLTSVDNPLVKRLRRLHEARHRREDAAFLVEGSRAIEGFLRAGWTPSDVLVRVGEPLPSTWSPVAVRQVSAAVAAKLSQASTPSGYLACFPRTTPAPVRPERGGLVLCEISDPGNLGTLVRCAAAFALPQVVLIGGAEAFSYKAIQASAGALATVAVHEIAVETGLAAVAGGAPLCALVVAGGQPPAAFAAGPRWLVVGSEAHGIRAEWLPLCSERLTLPMPGGTESLNAAMAAAIASYALFAPHSVAGGNGRPG